MSENQPGIVTEIIQVKVYSATGQSKLNVATEQISLSHLLLSESADLAIS